jgi:hypothetical protein
MELFIYVAMLVSDESREWPEVLGLGKCDEDYMDVKKTWVNFDAAACECTYPEDKRRLMSVIEGCPGGVESFNGQVQNLARSIFVRASCGLRWTLVKSEGITRSCEMPNPIPEKEESGENTSST